MNKVIIARIKEKIALNEKDYADAFIAKEANSTLKDPEAKKQVAAAELRMSTTESNITVLKAMLKKLTK